VPLAITQESVVNALYRRPRAIPNGLGYGEPSTTRADPALPPGLRPSCGAPGTVDPGRRQGARRWPLSMPCTRRYRAWRVDTAWTC